MTPPAARPSRAPGLLIGLGLGGFVDGILLHQVLQWHHLVSDTSQRPTTLPGLEANTLADGLFHTATWLLVVAGLVALVASWRSGAAAPGPGSLLGLLLAGWGAFNLLDAAVNHHLLGLHHVRDDLGGPLGWDLGWIAFALLLVAGGWALHRAGERSAGAPRT